MLSDLETESEEEKRKGNQREKLFDKNGKTGIKKAKSVLPEMMVFEMQERDQRRSQKG